jgi:hypothetical protein
MLRTRIQNFPPGIGSAVSRIKVGSEPVSKRSGSLTMVASQGIYRKNKEFGTLFRGLGYTLEPPPPPRDISQRHLGKNMKRGREKGGKMQDKKEERGRKRKKQKEKDKLRSKSVK